MENQSQKQGQRRRRNNRSGGGNRNRQGNRSGGKRQGGNRAQGGRNRNQSRRRPPKPTTWEKILSTITFGLLGKSPAEKQALQKPVVGGAARARETMKTKDPAPAAKRRRPRAEVTSGRLYVGNLDYSTTEGELEELFRGVGNVISAEVVTNSRTQQSKGFAFVEMGSIDEAKRAVEVLDDQDFMGRKLNVSGARSEGPRDSDDDDGDGSDADAPALADERA